MYWVNGFQSVWFYLSRSLLQGVGRGFLGRRGMPRKCPPNTKPIPGCNNDPVVQKPTAQPSRRGNVYKNKDTDDIDFQLCCLERDEKNEERRKLVPKGFRNPYTFMLRYG